MDSQKSMHKEHIVLGKFSREELGHIIRESSQINDVAMRIAFLSRQLLDTDYAESTLIGDKDTPEVFVINLKGIDCFTFIEYIEAMRLSDSFSEFEIHLRRVRYRSGIVDFAHRNHFFTDWREFNSAFVFDVTEEMSPEKTIKIIKNLNEKEDGTYFLPGIQPVIRQVTYIPSDAIDNPLSDNLRTGDYMGIYSNVKGLDVSHVGIIIKDEENIYLRHASSQKEYRKVIDQDFKNYMVNKPGIIVLRPKKVNPPNVD